MVYNIGADRLKRAHQKCEGRDFTPMTATSTLETLSLPRQIAGSLLKTVFFGGKLNFASLHFIPY